MAESSIQVEASPTFRRNLWTPGRWRKLKGVATIQLEDGTVCEAEVHGYEAHGIGKRETKIKYLLE
ncbi:MAG: hypothetical protein HC840_29375 [Leptolyngbyaceae cyanobacterium RM2_2_4]|nr:hypothetical protein [Leptolyngbyaceae cyanobacterium SL_5_14]NJO52828.1 hypothetical protein [Leptolyngbyaceae cyanobacterium RM2_2_4]